MKLELKKIKKSFILLSFCAIMAFASKVQIQENSGKFYAGVAYVASKQGASAEAGLAVGVAGVYASTLQGAIWGSAFGGAVGLAVGAGFGL